MNQLYPSRPGDWIPSKTLGCRRLSELNKINVSRSVNDDFSNDCFTISNAVKVVLRYLCLCVGAFILLECVYALWVRKTCVVVVFVGLFVCLFFNERPENAH